ncbi:hypothetical protein N658DRAFT_498448, partial [Parathielavia hyrcaniae]
MAMSPRRLIGVLLLASTAAAWSRTDHWYTTVQTRSLFSTWSTTSSISVIPTGAATPIASSISTTLVGDFEVTITDLFYSANASGICTPRIGGDRCTTTTTPQTTTTTATITTHYYAPVVISNPASCTLTSFAYTSARPFYLDALPSRAIPDFDSQATESVHALAVTTFVSTLSTNLGGQDVTASVCEVYLREDAFAASPSGGGGSPVVPTGGVHMQCVDPRVYECSVEMARASHFGSSEGLGGAFAPSTSEACRTDQQYPPARVTVGGAAGESGVAAGFRVSVGWLVGVVGVVVGLIGM